MATIHLSLPPPLWTREGAAGEHGKGEISQPSNCYRSLSTSVTKKATCHMAGRVTCLPLPGGWALELAGGKGTRNRGR